MIRAKKLVLTIFLAAMGLVGLVFETATSGCSTLGSVMNFIDVADGDGDGDGESSDDSDNSPSLQPGNGNAQQLDDGGQAQPRG